MLRVLCFLALTISAWAGDIQVFFSPNGGCTDAIVKEIAAAKSEILIQAYSFTSMPIAKALLDANTRGVKVTAILDKENQGRGYSAGKFLCDSGIPVWIDFLPQIAHSKIMIIDRAIIITGSFNFTRAAEEKNTENLLIIKSDPKLVQAYVANFQNRLALSRPYSAPQ